MLGFDLAYDLLWMLTPCQLQVSGATPIDHPAWEQCTALAKA